MWWDDFVHQVQWVTCCGATKTTDVVSEQKKKWAEESARAPAEYAPAAHAVFDNQRVAGHVLDEWTKGNVTVSSFGPACAPPGELSAEAEQGWRIGKSPPIAVIEDLGASPCSDSVDAQPSLAHKSDGHLAAWQRSSSQGSHVHPDHASPAPVAHGGVAQETKTEPHNRLQCSAPPPPKGVAEPPGHVVDAPKGLDLTLALDHSDERCASCAPTRHTFSKVIHRNLFTIQAIDFPELCQAHRHPLSASPRSAATATAPPPPPPAAGIKAAAAPNSRAASALWPAAPAVRTYFSRACRVSSTTSPGRAPARCPATPHARPPSCGGKGGDWPCV
jgi:hypothetical protein